MRSAVLAVKTAVALDSTELHPGSLLLVTASGAGDQPGVVRDSVIGSYTMHIWTLLVIAGFVLALPLDNSAN